ATRSRTADIRLRAGRGGSGPLLGPPPRALEEGRDRVVQITPFFAVPFGFVRRTGNPALDESLRTLFLAREAEGVRYANPRPLTQRNDRVFESHFQLFAWPEPCVRELKEFCWRALLGFIAELNGRDREWVSRMLIHADSWFHITRRGGFFALHNHPMAT